MIASSSNNNNTRCVCYICEEADENEELSTIRKKGKPALEKMMSGIGDSLLLQRWKNTMDTELRYHKSCKTELFNTLKKALRKQKSDELAEKEDSQQKRRRTIGGGVCRTPLLYKNRCILCNEVVKLYSNNPDLANKNYSQPDNLTSGELMNRFVKAADDRLAIDSNDKWAIEVKGHLLGINDLGTCS